MAIHSAETGLTQRPRIGWGLLSPWVLATALCFGLLPVLASGIGEMARVVAPTSVDKAVVDSVVQAVTVLVGIPLMAALQYLVLRRRVSQAGEWVFAVVIGVGAALIVWGTLVAAVGGWVSFEGMMYGAVSRALGRNPVLFLPSGPHGDLSRPAIADASMILEIARVASRGMMGMVFGICVGIPQYYILRQWVRRAGWWVLTSVIGWCFGMAAFAPVYSTLHGTFLSHDVNGWLPSAIIGWIATGVVLGVVTGIGLIRLLRCPLPVRPLQGAYIGWGPWYAWVFVTAVGMGLLPIVTLATGEIGLRVDLLHAVLRRTMGLFLRSGPLAVCAILIGVLQYLLLRRHVPRAGWWVLAAAFGTIAAMVLWTVALTPVGGWREGLVQPLERAVGHAIGKDMDAKIDYIIAQVEERWIPWTVGRAVGGGLFGMATGICVGIPQFLILRRRFRRAGWWVWANVIGWGMSMAVFQAMNEIIFKVFVTQYVSTARPDVFLMVINAVGGTSAGAVLGVATGTVLVQLLRQQPVYTPGDAAAD